MVVSNDIDAFQMFQFTTVAICCNMLIAKKTILLRHGEILSSLYTKTNFQRT